MASEPRKQNKNWLDWFLSLFTEVRGGEGFRVILLTLNLFLLLAAYYLLKPVREALVLTGGGAEAKSYLVGAMAVLLFFLVPAYSRLVSRFDRTKLITYITAFFIAGFIVFWALDQASGGAPDEPAPVVEVAVGMGDAVSGDGSGGLLPAEGTGADVLDPATNPEGTELGTGQEGTALGTGQEAATPLGTIEPEVDWGRRLLGYAFFVYLGIFSVMIMAQFWSFANDLYKNEAGKRLFPIIAFGASLGAVAGSAIADVLLEALPYMWLLLIASAVLGLCIMLTNIVARMQSGSGAEEAGESVAEAPPKGEATGFDLLFKHRYLGLIALLVLVLNLVNTNGEYLLGRMVSETAAAETIVAADAAIAAGTDLVLGEKNYGDPRDTDSLESYEGQLIGKFYTGFFFWVNLLGAVLQLFVVSRLVKYGGIRAGLLMLPIVAVGTYGLIAVVPVLAYARIGKTGENATDYSVNNTVRQMLFLPTSREIKYKAKQAIDAFMTRFGDVISAIVVLLGTQALGLGIGGFAMINLALIGVWFYVVLEIVREHKAVEAGERPELVEGEPPKPLLAGSAGIEVQDL